MVRSVQIPLGMVLVMILLIICCFGGVLVAWLTVHGDEYGVSSLQAFTDGGVFLLLP